MGGTPIKIGSFNMYKFNWRSDNEIRKNISKIAEIIQGEEFDILAMQEVFNEQAARLLLQELGLNWDMRWASPISRSVQQAEGYAYLWKRNKFQLATGRRCEDDVSPGASKVFTPDIWGQYRKDPILDNGRLARDPFYIRLESLHGWYEIRLINTHILFGDSTADIAKRQHELEALIHIYCKLSDKLYRSGRPFYTFLLGDYNLNLPGVGKAKAYIPEHCNPVRKYENGILRKQIVTLQDKPTTLGCKEDTPGQRIWEFANNYDHFTFDELRFEGMKFPDCYRIDSVRKYCDDDFERHKAEVSDHIPICLQFSLTDRP